ncbi:MAG: type III secretion system chaperone [Chlamydiota bacterium]
MIEQHITHLMEDLGLPPITSKDSKGYFQIPLQGDLKISLKDLSPGFELVSSLGPILNQNKEELLTYLMKANFLGQGTGEQIIGMNLDEKFLTLSRSITYEINYPKFKEILEDFTNYLIYWTGEVKRIQTIQPTP